MLPLVATVSSAVYLNGDAHSLLDSYMPQGAALCEVHGTAEGQLSVQLGTKKAQTRCADPPPTAQRLRRLESVQRCMGSPCMDDPLGDKDHLALSSGGCRLESLSTEQPDERRLESVQLCMSSPSVDDPLDNEEQLADQMDALPYMCRLQYAHTQEYLCGIMDPLITAASEQTGSGKALSSCCLSAVCGRGTSTARCSACRHPGLPVLTSVLLPACHS